MIDTNRPVPAAIDGRQWTVSDAPHGFSGGTDTKRADMFAPLASTPTARMIRNHELIHARITPRVNVSDAAKKHGVTVDALQWAEDYRVGLLQSRLGLIDVDAMNEEESATFTKGIVANRRLVAGIMLATLSTPSQYVRLRLALRAHGFDEFDLDEICAAVREIAVAAYPTRRRGRRGKGVRFKAAGFAKHTAPLALMFDSRFPMEPPPGEQRSEEARQANKRVQRIKGTSKWGTLENVIRLPLTIPIRPRRPIGRRFSDSGVIPSAVHRLPVDGSIFATRRRARGGTILCDASGSMEYLDEDIERIIRTAPAATIAFYAGHHSAAGPAGNIVIAAAGGRAAAVDEVYKALAGGQNFIDGPALRWLAKQDGPRTWVSDEEVGGGGNDYGRGGACHAECRQICIAGGIAIAHTIDDVK